MKNENNTESQNPARRYSKRSFYLNKKKNLENHIENPEPKIEQKIETKIEQINEPNIESKIEPKIEIKKEPKIEPKIEIKIKPKIEPKIETKIEHKKEQKIEQKIETKIKPKIETKIKVVKKAVKTERKPYIHHSHPKLKQKKLFFEDDDNNNDLLSFKKYHSFNKNINIETLQKKLFFSENKNSKKSYKSRSKIERGEILNKSNSAKTMEIKINKNNINDNTNKNEIKNENKININSKQEINSGNNKTNEIKVNIKIDKANKNQYDRNNNTKPKLNMSTTLTQNSATKTKTNKYISTNVNVTSTKTNVTKNVVEVKKNKQQQKMDMLKSQGKSLLLGAPKKECPMCHKYIETHLLKIHMNVHFSQILHWLFLGNFENACDIKELRRNNITYILNCAIECKNKTLPKSINELHLDVRDEPEFNIIKYFDKSNAFINKVRTEGGSILVHCKMGLSRSPSFIIAFLIKYYGFTVDSAISFLKRKRPYVNINHGFIEQLHQYENSFKKKSKK